MSFSNYVSSSLALPNVGYKFGEHTLPYSLSSLQTASFAPSSGTIAFPLKNDPDFGPPNIVDSDVNSFGSYIALRSNGASSARINSLSALNQNGFFQDDLLSSPLFYEKLRKKFVQTAFSENLEYGYESASEVLIHSFAEQYPSAVGGLIQHIFMKEVKNPKIIVSLLKGVSSLPYNSVYPYAQVMAIAALTNSAADVKEAGIRAFENWENPEGILALETAETPWPWLDTYRQNTISYLESFR